MQCEVIAVGTELLLGQIIDTNSAWLGEQLALAGINSHFQTRVGDNLERIVTVLRIALKRSDAVIMCGGLGPTQDDITREAIAEVMGVSLVCDDGLAARIREKFKARKRDMPANNLRQAELPRGASVIPQMPGTAPGLICPLGDKVVYAVPGVPYELKSMVIGTVIPDLQRRSGRQWVIRSRTLRTWGQSESGIAEMLAGRIGELDKVSNPTLAFLASGIEGIKVRITARASDPLAADQILSDEETRLRAILGNLVFAVDDQTMESTVIALLRRRGLTLGIVETISGGLAAARLSAVPDSGEVFRGGIFCPSHELCSRVLGISEQTTASAAASQALALGVCQRLETSVGLATVGEIELAEPAAQPVGIVFLGLAISGHAESHQLRFPSDQERIRQFSVISLLNLLRLRLLAGSAR